MNSVQSDLEAESLNLLCSDISNTVENESYKAYRMRQKSFENGGREGGFEIHMKCLEKKTSIKRRISDARNDSRTKQRDLDRKIAVARRDVRLRVKAFSCDLLLTFTRSSRGGSWQLSDWQRAFRRLVAKLRRSGMDFKYIAVPQRHKSGEWHVHMAINKAVDIHYVLEEWKKLAGENSAVNITGRRHGETKLVRVAKMASYITKTLSDDWHCFPAKAKHFWGSVGAVVEQKSWIIEAESLDGAIATLASQLGIDFEKLMSNPSCRVFFRDGSGIFLNYLPFLDSRRRKHTLH